MWIRKYIDDNPEIEADVKVEEQRILSRRKFLFMLPAIVVLPKLIASPVEYVIEYNVSPLLPPSSIEVERYQEELLKIVAKVFQVTPDMLMDKAYQKIARRENNKLKYGE